MMMMMMNLIGECWPSVKLTACNKCKKSSSLVSERTCDLCRHLSSSPHVAISRSTHFEGQKLGEKERRQLLKHSSPQQLITPRHFNGQKTIGFFKLPPHHQRPYQTMAIKPNWPLSMEYQK
jgi:hypothetical protein